MLILEVRQIQFQEIMVDSPSRSSRPASAPLRCSKATFNRCMTSTFCFSFASSPNYVRENKMKGPLTCSHGHMTLCSIPQSPCYILGLPERIHDYNRFSGHWYIRQMGPKIIYWFSHSSYYTSVGRAMRHSWAAETILIFTQNILIWSDSPDQSSCRQT